MAINWKIVGYSAGRIEIDLGFLKPLYISFEKEPDTLIVEFADEDLFITDKGIKIQEKHRILSRKLARQLPESAQSL